MKNQKQEFKSVGKHTGKKPYRKPTVQVYGTLTQMTGAAPGPGIASDNGQVASASRRT
jgi:hypothetical protein